MEAATPLRQPHVRTVGDRLKLVPYSTSIYVGVPVLLFSVLGVIELWRRPRPDVLGLTLAGWTASCLLFLLVGILTPVDMRYYLAAVPVLAITAGYGAAWAWNEAPPVHRNLWRVAAAVFLGGTISTGFHNWWNTLG